ncbi:TnpV protein [Enterococcus pallens]|uniref:TnpV protein n=2 Tax=Enterococcus pallens TaxID=160454 RepID=UPI003D15DF48
MTMPNNLDQLNQYQEKMNQQNQAYKRRTKPIVALDYQEENGLLYPKIMLMAGNHELNKREMMIQEYLKENQAALYHELYLSGELMIYLKNKEEQLKMKEQKIFHELLQQRVDQLPTELLQRTRIINQLKEQAHETALKDLLPL